MSEHPFSKAEYRVRRDGSLIMSFGDPVSGPHEQFDFYGSEELAALIVASVKHFLSEPSEYERLIGGNNG